MLMHFNKLLCCSSDFSPIVKKSNFHKMKVLTLFERIYLNLIGGIWKLLTPAILWDYEAHQRPLRLEVIRYHWVKSPKIKLYFKFWYLVFPSWKSFTWVSEKWFQSMKLCVAVRGMYRDGLVCLSNNLEINKVRITTTTITATFRKLLE